ncbi:hypothetical protein LYSHEL_19280 [Lysobacter helvus]|uniref:Late embryogenesis abundant protein LEA-2 subgroup domain-containing protein n=2 Tax=Lysobacteraceae TaxID=32033 RepID=A0ABN6FTY3_9GAMM|nr:MULTISPECIES: LEA type 2 family protein [Lysobacter]BCT92904.1 hypothetical protein LYSCAS_19280 [Lysobacter caseinilyticus]BCT96057.1 hypothetical protein LYSHEL_19280 [Lysobacter helvus]
MAKFGRLVASATFLLVTLAACGGGPVKRVSEPAAGIQQLTVRADGQWSVDLRIDNFSSVPMRFDAASLVLTIGGENAGTLAANPGLTIGPESADVATLTLAPSSAARITVADALSNRRELAYTLKGTLDAGPEGEKSRQYRIDRSSALNPAPGLPGVLR